MSQPQQHQDDFWTYEHPHDRGHGHETPGPKEEQSAPQSAPEDPNQQMLPLKD